MLVDNYLILRLIALSGDEELIQNGVDVGSEVREIGTLGADEVCMNFIELLMTLMLMLSMGFFSRHDDLVC